MTLSLSEVGPGLQQEYQAFADLIRSLSDEEWRTPTRCEGWSTGDVAAHVIGTLTDVVNGNLADLGTPETIARQVEERRGRSPEQLAEELEASGKVAADMVGSFSDELWEMPAPPGVEGTLGWGVEALWYDTVVHADDIRTAVGRSSQPGPGIRAAVSHVAIELEKRNWGPATLALEGVEEFPVGSGEGSRVTGDAWQFVLAATGRADGAPFNDVPNIYAD
ncbi:MAG TPA: maleylpyruvate isomerase family mycothiol-dependent enzyme [Acidimicrobiales bacterium]|nr:maleylpyruvate isomerase family mycothiol-dependent enzyme [Acidimicrobiales bacterium]